MKGYYVFVQNDRHLRQIAEEMKAVARVNPIDPDKAKDLIANEPGKQEVIGPMIRSHGAYGQNESEMARKYSRFITFSARTPVPLQVSYIEYRSGNIPYLVRQLTVVHNNSEKLDPGHVSRIAHFFLENPFALPDVNLPQHVAVLFERTANGEERPQTP